MFHWGEDRRTTLISTLKSTVFWHHTRSANSGAPLTHEQQRWGGVTRTGHEHTSAHCRYCMRQAVDESVKLPSVLDPNVEPSESSDEKVLEEDPEGEPPAS